MWRCRNVVTRGQEWPLWRTLKYIQRTHSLVRVPDFVRLRRARRNVRWMFMNVPYGILMEHWLSAFYR
jgi:hypothetical protein